jgi:putative membrane protein
VGHEASHDPQRRTRLANERTYLAWWRTALTAFAVSLGTGKLVPALTDESSWPYVLIGAGFALIGIVFSVGALLRHRAVDRAVDEGEFAPVPEAALATLAIAGAALGVALLVVTLSDL